MAEPQSTATGFLAVLAAVAASISPSLAKWVSPAIAEMLVIVIGAVGGAFLRVMEQDTPQQRVALKLAAKGFVMACVFTAFASVLLEGWGPEQLRGGQYGVLLALAAVIAWQQERMVKLVAKWRQGRPPTEEQ